jgi:hypothetical protein
VRRKKKLKVGEWKGGEGRRGEERKGKETGRRRDRKQLRGKKQPP